MWRARLPFPAKAFRLTIQVPMSSCAANVKMTGRDMCRCFETMKPWRLPMPMRVTPSIALHTTASSCFLC